jgi:hypothetical protein
LGLKQKCKAKDQIGAWLGAQRNKTIEEFETDIGLY